MTTQSTVGDRRAHPSEFHHREQVPAPLPHPSKAVHRGRGSLPLAVAGHKAILKSSREDRPQESGSSPAGCKTSLQKARPCVRETRDSRGLCSMLARQSLASLITSMDYPFQNASPTYSPLLQPGGRFYYSYLSDEQIGFQMVQRSPWQVMEETHAPLPEQTSVLM